MIILFSIAVWVFSFVWMAILAIVTLILLPFFPYRRTHAWVAAPGFSLVARAVNLGRFEVFYDAKFDPKRRSVFCQNHINLLDAYVAAAAIPHAFCGLMHAWQFRIPFYGWLMTLSKGIPLHRNRSPKEILQEMTEGARDRAAQGFSILVFPEGGRTTDGHTQRFKRGVFFMARDAGLPVVPVAVRGMYDVNRKGSLRFRPGRVSVYVGRQFETVGLSDEKVGELSDRLQEIVSTFVETGHSMDREVRS
ncbi:MAG TPA: lysophospholipid acyltransferase family protein [Bdellovibrionota bacterium]|nr:lysophospholipid acyltransferase family protein [Bdellovibrionota bacterium]